jgi:putative N-acetyltransferase (TIGR04045 family)
VSSPEELAFHHRIRAAVFVAEQRLFAVSDIDEHDTDPATIHLLGLVGGEPAGTVRLFPLGAGLWQGDRLAVLRDQRHAGVGAPLVRLAVRTAGELGGEVMTAHIQQQNVRFFTSLGWALDGAPEDYLGVPHQSMRISLR